MKSTAAKPDSFGQFASELGSINLDFVVRQLAFAEIAVVHGETPTDLHL